MLTEERIKRASLRFLKDHYKFHPRVGATSAQFDLESDNGIIADGQYSFTTQDGKQFIATFEATSEYVFEEVKYRQEKQILFFDSLAAGFIIAALTFLYGYLWQKFTIKEVGWPMTISIVALAGFIGFFVYRFLVKRRNRYRYIYAVEQFKRYHADDQWIAISDRIFPNSEDVYYDELRRQCVDNGIGLLTVSATENVNMVIAPARQDEFSNRRKLANFANQNIKIGGVLSRRISDKGRKMFDRIMGKSKNKNSLNRYRRSSYKQLFICLLSSCFMAFLFSKQWNDLPISYVDTKTFEQTVLNKVEQGDMETLEYLLDTSAAVQEGTYQSGYLDIAPTPIQKPEQPKIAKKIPTWIINHQAEEGGRVYLNSQGSAYSSYDCERLFNFEDQLFLLSYQLFADFESAKAEVAKLAAKGMDANILWLGCFVDRQEEYALYFDLLFPDEASAKKALARYSSRLDRTGLSDEQLKLVRITK